MQDRFEAAANGEDDAPQGTPLKMLPTRVPPKIQKKKHRKAKSMKMIIFDNDSQNVTQNKLAQSLCSRASRA